MALTVACVLRSGGEYTPAHVHQLYNGVRRYLSRPFRFVCLTDMPVLCESLPLKHRWPGWWSKAELFSEFKGPTIYLDLDTLIVGPLDDIVLGHRFTVLQNFWAEQFNEPDRIGSGLMAWNTDLSAIYRKFASAPDRFMREYKTKARWGDQAFIKDHTPVPMERWQQKYPGKVVSFKKHVLPNRGLPAGAAICVFHGLPRPWGLKPHERAWFDRMSEAA